MDATVALPADAEQRKLRVTWYTVLLILWHASPLWLVSPAPHAHPHPFRVATKFIVLAFMWGGFYVTYWAISASGLTLSEVLGPRWTSWPEFWSDLKQGFLLFLLIFVASYFFARLSPFNLSGTARPSTGVQYLLTLVVAISAGFTEEAYFRGFLLSQLKIVTRSTPVAAFLQAFLFAAAHGGNQTLTQFLKHYFSGCLFAYSRIRRNSLWPAILGHVLVDVVAFSVQFLHARRR